MTHLDERRLDMLLARIRGKTIAVVGDLMLDRYYWGSVHRISPEAPVPVVDVESEQVRLGGAANVANNIQTLGGVPLMVGLIGDDHAGQTLREMMRDRGFEPSGLVVDPQRQTTTKTRVIAQGQHIVRVDNETKAPCPAPLADRLIGAVRERIGEIVEDMQDLDLGINTPVSFGPGRHQGLDMVYYTKVEHDRFVTLTDWKEWAQ